MTLEDIEARIIEALDTLRRLPPVFRKQRTGYWPDIVRTRADIFGQGTYYQHTADLNPTRRVPTGREIDRMDEVIEHWWRWIPKRDRKPIYWHWRGDKDTEIAKIIGVERRTVKRRRENAYKTIQRILIRRAKK